MVTAAEKFLKHKKYVIKYFMYLCMHVCMYAYVSLYVMKLNDLSIYFFFIGISKRQATDSVGLKSEVYLPKL